LANGYLQVSKSRSFKKDYRTKENGPGAARFHVAHSYILNNMTTTPPTDAQSTDSIVLGGGCFWCLEAAYQEVAGVTKVVSGYAGGETENPTYERVASATTGHAEVVKVDFDTSKISLEHILEIFWALHDPTTLNRQNHDVGPEYRSIILFNSPTQQKVVEASRDDAQKLLTDPIVTEIKPLEVFHQAEDYHQNYFRNNPDQAYCQIVINPKLKKLRATFADRLKAL
jgi:methionine-S-sulfoxide reductase